jgi:chaperonin GroES
VSAVEAYVEPDEEVNDTPAPKATKPVQRLMELINSPNLVEDMDEEDAAKLSARVIAEYDIDKNSRKEWEKRAEAAMDLAMMVAGKDKDYPFPKASNVKWPLIAEAAIQYNSLAYPAIVQGDRVAKGKTNGKDPTGAKAARAERVSEHLSWQLTTEMPEWEDDTDRLLLILPIVGCAFRKTYYDPALGRKCSRLVTADRFVINYYARTLEDAPRFTEQLWLYPLEIQERILDGRFIEFDYGVAEPDTDSDEGSGKEDSADVGDDEDAPHLFLEQHRNWDLDKDGYPEPYIVTVHKQSGKICRVVANFTIDTCRLTADGSKVVAIRPQTFFTVYRFLQSPDGGFYGMGLGTLLHTTNEAINATMNEMLDAGHLSNIQGGFVSAALSIREKTFRLKMGEWKVLPGGMPLNQAVMPITYPGPSDTLFKLVGLLIEQGKSLASVKDVMTGETGGKVMQPTTVLALIEQGMRVVQANFKRTHRAIKAELKIHGRLNFEHLDAETYNAFFDDQQPFDPKADYNPKDMDIVPVSDPSVSTRMQAMAKAQVAREIGTGTMSMSLGL